MSILFICEGNMMRSQMAEAFYNHATSSNDAISAGAIAENKRHISPRAITVMNEVGIDVSTCRPTQVTRAMVDRADKVIYFPSDFMPDYVIENRKAEFWDVADPHYQKERGIAFVEEARDDIKERVSKLL